MPYSVISVVTPALPNPKRSLATEALATSHTPSTVTFTTNKMVAALAGRLAAIARNPAPSARSCDCADPREGRDPPP
ncbi:hypothetical protein LAUMK191_05641 [Mycobacterium attenuatum]|nr:hypothetical protein LAUMK191_05641 [Mycobacterium attenuatum]